MSDLFRKQVLEKQGQRLYGDVILAAPLSQVAIALLLTAPMTALVIFISVGEYTRIETFPAKSISGVEVRESDDPLGSVFEISIDSNYAGLIKNGQEARIFYDAYPRDRFGFDVGEVINVRSPENLKRDQFIVTVKQTEMGLDCAEGDCVDRGRLGVRIDLVFGRDKIKDWLFQSFFGRQSND